MCNIRRVLYCYRVPSYRRSEIDVYRIFPVIKVVKLILRRSGVRTRVYVDEWEHFVHQIVDFRKRVLLDSLGSFTHDRTLWIDCEDAMLRNTDGEIRFHIRIAVTEARVERVPPRREQVSNVLQTSNLESLRISRDNLSEKRL